MVMISGLVSVTGLRSQSPNCASIAKPASARKADSGAAPRNRRMLSLGSGRFQALLA